MGALGYADVFCDLPPAIRRIDPAASGYFFVPHWLNVGQGFAFPALSRVPPGSLASPPGAHRATRKSPLSVTDPCPSDGMLTFGQSILELQP